MKLSICTLMALLLFVQCKSSKQDLDKSKSEVEKSFAEKELGEVSDEMLNADKTLLLAVSGKLGENPSVPNQMKKYIVINQSSNEVVYQGVIQGGYVKWLDNENLEAFSSPGMVLENQNKDDLIQVINVVSGEKTTMTLYKAKKN